MNNSDYSQNDNMPISSGQNSTPDITEESARFEYIYSFESTDSEPTPTPKRPKKSPKGLKTVLAALLCATLSFGAAFAGAKLANVQLGTSSATTGKGASVLHKDPEEILEKSESEYSVYGSAGENVLTVSQVVNKVEDSIVVINSTIYTQSYFGTQQSTSAGSGVIIDESGYLLTCYHVVEGASKIVVTLTSGEKYEASLVGGDSATDIAVLKITPDESLPAVKQGCSADLVVGEYVIAIGNPLGTLSGTVTSGIISATERKITVSEDGTVMTLLQTDTAINSGNSGGGLFNLQGKLIGIVNAKYASSGVEGLAFAIPIDSAYEVQKDLIEYGYVRGVIDTGLETIDITEENLRQNSLYYSKFGVYAAGVYVTESKYYDELKNADRIIAINDVEVNTTAELNAAIKQYRVGDTLTVRASRAEEEFTMKITLREYVPAGYGQSD